MSAEPQRPLELLPEPQQPKRLPSGVVHAAQKLFRMPTIALLTAIAQPDNQAVQPEKEVPVEVIKVPEVTPYTLFTQHYTEAQGRIKQLAQGSQWNEEQKEILREAEAYPGAYILALAIKESRLDADDKDGYLQVTPDAIADLNRVFPTLKLTKEQLDKDPTANIQFAIIYFSLIKQKYVDDDEDTKNLSPKNKYRLTHFYYNLGPGAGKRLWVELQPSDVDDLLKKAEALVAQRLGDPTLVEGSEVMDEAYRVLYFRTELEQDYLDALKEGEQNNEASFQKPAFPMHGPYPSLQKIVISDRYVRIVDALTTAIAVPAQRYAYMHESGLDQPIDSRATDIIEIESGMTFWALTLKYGVSEAYLKRLNPGLKDLQVGRTIKVPEAKVYKKAEPYLFNGNGHNWVKATSKGFYKSLVADPAYASYLAESVQVTAEETVDVILVFNQLYNPELEHLTSETLIPRGAMIWIPNVKFFIDYYADKVDKKTPPQTGKEPQPEPVIEAVGGGPLTKNTVGQYVMRSGNTWVRDVAAMAEGAKEFAEADWDDHPAWTPVGDLKKKRFAGEKGLIEVRYIVLHSTISRTSDSTINGKKAHFAVERDGTIKYIVSVKKEDDSEFQIAPHAGISRWGNDEDLNRYAIGIEVVAEAKQDWSKEQFAAVKRLVHWIGGYYDLQERDVLMHAQIGYDRLWGRGRKSDPSYSGGFEGFFSRLELPNNANLLDVEVAQGDVKPNAKAINKDANHLHDAWPGLRAADEAF